MDVSVELDRIFPVPLPESDLSKAQDELFKFLGTLSKVEYELAMELLPDKPRLEFEDTEQTHGFFPLSVETDTSVKQVFWDTVSRYTVLNYLSHALAGDVISYLLKRNKKKPGPALIRLAGKLSFSGRTALFERLILLEPKDAKGRPQTQGEFEEYLEAEFGKGRIGMTEYALEMYIETYRKPGKTNRNRGTITGDFEHYILTLLLLKRRGEFSRRLGKIDSVNKARFAAEEVRRELFMYPGFQAKHASSLCMQIYNWYNSSKARETARKEPSSLFSYVMQYFGDISARINLGIYHELTDIPDYVKPSWDAYVGKFIINESFWHSIQGLNGEVPLEETMAGQNIIMYRQSAKLVGAIYVAAILMPFIIGAAIRAPGAVISAIRWTGGRLLLGTQHVYTTIKTFGLLGGGARLVQDVYHFYLRNPITINQVITNGTEIVLDLTGSGTGMAPGSSPNDAAAAVTQKIGKMTKAGISKLADELADAAHGAQAEIHSVEMIVKGEDGNFYRIYSSVKSGDQNVLKLKVDKFENLGKQVDADAQKKILLGGKPRNDNSIAEARGTLAKTDADAKPVDAVSDNVIAQELKPTGTDGYVIMGTKGKPPVKPVAGSNSSKGTAAIDTGARNTSNNGAGSMSRMSGATSKKPPPLVINLAKPGAIKKLADANPTIEDVINVLKDPRLFELFKNSMKKGSAVGIQAANDIGELGAVLARFTVRTQNGIVRAETVVSDALWRLPEHARGVMIEEVLARSQYKDWHHSGQLDHGFFPDIDFSVLKNGLDQRVSLKTVNPYAKGYHDAIYDTLQNNLGSLVDGTRNGRGRGYKITSLLDVRLPLGNPTARADLLKTLNDWIPADVKNWVAAVVDEF